MAPKRSGKGCYVRHRVQEISASANKEENSKIKSPSDNHHQSSNITESLLLHLNTLLGSLIQTPRKFQILDKFCEMVIDFLS